ncbi:MAG: 50S ribosomal protein L25 [Planctomycetaceae bacterium]|nr:50S ribosomal protein L25 [Planctomycetaceae bacterium]
MAEDPKLVAQPRAKLGTAECRRLRRDAKVPGNIYGHGEAPVTIAVPAESLIPIVHSGHKVVDLELDGSSQKAMFREVQWDTFGSHLIHFDLQRVSADERVTTEVAVETHGTSPGVLAGGILEMPLHTIRIECPALQIPDRIEVNINHIDLGGAIHVGDLQLPPDVKVLNDPDEIVLHVVRPTVTAEELEAASGTVEPELVKKTTETEPTE